jgi:hypothetical protein
MPGNRKSRCEVLYNLAHNTERGWIVELGAFRGCGALALHYGSASGHRMPVATVDDWVEKKGWADEPYGEHDKRILDENFKTLEVDIAVVRMDVHLAANSWLYQVGLIVWDLGVPVADKTDLFVDSWNKHVISGGMVAFHDTPQKALGYPLFEEALLATGK